MYYLIAGIIIIILFLIEGVRFRRGIDREFRSDQDSELENAGETATHSKDNYSKVN